MGCSFEMGEDKVPVHSNSLLCNTVIEHDNLPRGAVTYTVPV